MTQHRRPEIRFTDAPRGVCRWCGEDILHTSGGKTGDLNRRRRWHPDCLTQYEASDPNELRRRIRHRDKGVCVACGLKTNKLKREVRGRGRAKELRSRGFLPRRSLWELDHIVPLIDGGTHDLSNLQTLCVPCHRSKTADEARDRSLARQAMRTVEEPLAVAPERAAPRAPHTSTSIANLDALLEQAASVNERAERALQKLGSSGRP